MKLVNWENSAQEHTLVDISALAQSKSMDPVNITDHRNGFSLQLKHSLVAMMGF